MFMDLCDDVINIVKQWTPKKNTLKKMDIEMIYRSLYERN
jgi:hypothetical protein